MEAISYFMGGWYWEDIPRENVVERIMFFPFAIATIVIGAPMFVAAQKVIKDAGEWDTEKKGDCLYGCCHWNKPEEKECCESFNPKGYCLQPNHCICHKLEVSQEKDIVKTNTGHCKATEPSFIERKVEEFRERFCEPYLKGEERGEDRLIWVSALSGRDVQEFLRTALEEQRNSGNCVECPHQSGQAICEKCINFIREQGRLAERKEILELLEESISLVKSATEHDCMSGFCKEDRVVYPSFIELLAAIRERK